ncbi:hypothetical protein [Streptomyces sp. NPDC048419]|uniref:hypothetical protein n=1 Tax=Streptomyces sp. NPDC048419 TaxID=3365547 RepID=UPI00371AB2BC
MSPARAVVNCPYSESFSQVLASKKATAPAPGGIGTWYTPRCTAEGVSWTSPRCSARSFRTAATSWL